MWRKILHRVQEVLVLTHAQHCFSLTVCVCVGEGACTDESWVVDLSLVTLRHRLLSAVTQSQLTEELLLIGLAWQKNR